jgi:glycosyltransferase involved in cell wall biosynthesis
MRILWITNVPTPEASGLIDSDLVPFGGWTVNLSSLISKINQIELNIVFPINNLSKVLKFQGNQIKYFAFPDIEGNYSKRTIENNIVTIFNEIKPDIVHIFGTESRLATKVVEICYTIGIKHIIHLQGLLSIYSKHYMASLPIGVQRKGSLRDILKRDNLIQQLKKFELGGRFEKIAIKKTNYFIGYTTWDEACVKQINPDASYYRFNDILRESFYGRNWQLDKCERNSIFISQGHYPLKGLHYVIESMPLILRNYPKTKLYVGGLDITRSKSKLGFLLRTTYSNFLLKRINELSLRDNIVFLGLLNEKEMCERYLSSHVFVSPSSIENTSFSLLEAKYLGVPSIASYVGGVIDLIDHGLDGFYYQHDAPYMLASYILKIFNNDELALSLSENSRTKAIKKHDPFKSIQNLTDIYNRILNS